MEHRDYIEERNGGYYVAGTRVSLDSVVHSFNQGNSPEGMLEQFPLVDSLANIYGAIAYYLDHKAVMDDYLERSAQEFDALSVPMVTAAPAFWRKLEDARAKLSGQSV